MKQLLKANLITIIVLSLFSCSPKPKIEGSFIKVKENERGTNWNVFNKGLVKELDFGEKICRFSYFGITMSGEYTIDNNYIYVNVGGELGTLSMEIIDNQTLEGEGWASGTFKKKK